MWKYKLSCPFGGYGYLVLFGFFVVFGMFMPFWFMESDSRQIWVFRTFPFLVPLTAFVIAHWKNSEERKKIRESEKLTWEPLRTDLGVIKPDKKWFWTLLILTALLLVGAVLAFIAGKSGEDPDFCRFLMLACLILAGAAVLPFAYTCCYIYFWSHIDNTAELASITVDHSYKAKAYRRYGPDPTILVCYLPDGRYRFFHDQAGSPPNEVLLIRYKGHIRVWGLEQSFGLR